MVEGGVMRAQVKEYYLPMSDKKIAGVCKGLALYFAVDATLVRLLVVFVTLATGILPGVVTYVCAMIIAPQEITVGQVK